MNKRIICIAPIDYKGKNIPSPEEIADTVYRSYNAGASIVHLHCVDKNGNSTPDLSLFTQTLNLIRQKCNIIIEASTGGDSTSSMEDRSLVVISGVEQASLNMGSVNLSGSPFVNSEETIRYIAEKMSRYKVKAELEIFNEPMIDLSLKLRDEGLLSDPLQFGLFVIDNEESAPEERKIGKLSQKYRRILTELESIPANCEVSICNNSRKDFSTMTFAISLGLNIRVGYEDSKFISPGKLAKDNAEIVEEVAKIMRCTGLDIANADEARKMLKISNYNN